MRIVVAVDWSEQAFTAVQAVTQLYRPRECVLVHAVDLRPFESPFMAPAIAKGAYDGFRQALLDSGRQLLEQTADLVSATVPSIRRVCETGSTAEVILNAATSTGADLVVVGTHGRGGVGEVVLGSVSHRVVEHAPCPALIVKRPLADLSRVLVAVQGADDRARLTQWLQRYPFQKAVRLSVLSAVPVPHVPDPFAIPAFSTWEENASRMAKNIVDRMTCELNGVQYDAIGHVYVGNATEVIAQQAEGHDVVIVGSHGSKGMERFLLESVSHAIVHRVPCSVLVVREISDPSGSQAHPGRADRADMEAKGT